MLEAVILESSPEGSALVEIAIRLRVEGSLFHAFPNLPEAGSPFGDADALYPWEKSSDWCREYLSAALESALLWADFHAPLSFGEGLRVNIRPRPIHGLARGCLESAAQAVWVMTADSAADLAMRHLRLMHTDVAEQKRALALRGRGAATDVVYERLKERASESFDWKAVAKAQTYVRCIRESATAMGADADEHEFLWRQASGATHGKRWAALELNDVQSLGEYEPGQLNVVRTPRLEPMIDVLTAALRTVQFGVAVYAARAGFEIGEARRRAVLEVAEQIPVDPGREGERQDVVRRLSAGTQ